MNLTFLDDLANLLFISAYLVKDILWLRLLSIVGSLTVLPYYLLRPEPLTTPAMWSCVFIGINATRAWGIVRERRPVPFSADEQLLYDRTFSTLSPAQFKRLLAIGTWRDLEPGYVLHATGDPPGAITAIVRGELEERRHGRVLGHAGAGDLAGLVSLLGGSVELYDATVTRPARVLCWDVVELRERTGHDAALTAALRKIAGAAVAQKLVQVVEAEG